MSWSKSIDRVDDAQAAHVKACQTHGANSPEAQAADQKADAEEARHIRDYSNRPTC